MPRNTDWEYAEPIRDRFERVLDTFGDIFEDVRLDKVSFLWLTGKRKVKRVVQVKAAKFPDYTEHGFVYFVLVHRDRWEALASHQQNLAVFRALCALPDGGFDETSKFYGKVQKPDYEVYWLEFCASGGVLNWMEGDGSGASDPLAMVEDDLVVPDETTNEERGEDGTVRTPVTAPGVARRMQVADSEAASA